MSARNSPSPGSSGDDVFSGRRELPAAQVSQTVDRCPQATVLVIYTGGTIGMKTNVQGVYEPKANYLISELRKLPMFHDQSYAANHFLDDGPECLVLPLAAHGNHAHENGKLQNGDIQNGMLQTGDFQNVPKRTTWNDEQGKRIVYHIKEYLPLLDSSNMTMTDWSKIASDISSSYDEYDGFVVLHGTDTMAYTASALSFMCENLGKPIILTGSQIPIFEVRSDGRDNFLSALIVAGQYLIPEVLVCFDNKVFRGNRTIKCDAGSFSAFTSPNMLAIAEMNIDIKVDWGLVHRSHATEKFRIHTNMCENVGLLRIFPGITHATVRAFLTPPMQGIVLQSYGAGNAPDNRPDLLKIFEAATNLGVIVINITQCTKGYVDATYATGKALYDKGVLPGGDMTPEAALAKLSYVLGKPWSIERKKEMMTKNLRGEVLTIKKDDLSAVDFELIEAVSKSLNVSDKKEIKQLKDALYPNMMCAAAKNGDINSLERLRDTGGNLSAQNQDGRTALHVASREGHQHVVQFLLNEGASIHTKDHHDDTPLMDAIKGKNFPIIALLVNTGAHLRHLHHIRIAMELCSAAAQDDVNTLKAWRAAGTDMNVADYDRRTPLHVAVSTKQVNAVKYLLDNGARTDNEDAFSNTVDIQASIPGYEEIKSIIDKVNGTSVIK